MLAGAEPPEEIIVEEHGIRMLIDVRAGHKTGSYLDQRPNRLLAHELLSRVESASSMLNLFSYNGGFSLQGLRVPGVHAINVDSSAPALALAARNAELNGAADRCTQVTADVFKWLREEVTDTGSQDLVVLDPPKFAHNRGQVDRASRGYKDLNRLAMRHVKPGGYLMTFSCSGAVSADLFQKIVFSGMVESGRRAQVIRHLEAGEDHPVALTFPEGAYLKGLLLQVW